MAIADHALTDEAGRHTTCFIMELDKSALPNLSTLTSTMRNSPQDVRTQFGWQEYWQFNPEVCLLPCPHNKRNTMEIKPIDSTTARSKFRDDIEDCRSASHWYFLKPTVNTRDESCSGCYDFW